MDMLTPRRGFTAAVLNGKVFVVGGQDGRSQVLSSTEFIDVYDLLEYVPLHYLKADDNRGDNGDVDEASCKKPKTIQSFF